MKTEITPQDSSSTNPAQLEEKVKGFSNLSPSEQGERAEEVVAATDHTQSLSTISKTGWLAAVTAPLFALIDTVILSMYESPLQSIGIPSIFLISANYVILLLVLLSGIGILRRYEVARKTGLMSSLASLILIVPSLVSFALVGLIGMLMFAIDLAALPTIYVVLRIVWYVYMSRKLSEPRVRARFR